MNTPIRRTSLGVLLMFLSLYVAATMVQVVQFDELREDPHNTRTLLQSYETERGPILVNGEPIAYSTPVDTEYKYQRVYEHGELYANLTGYFTHTQGATGMESAMNAELSGQSDAQFFEGLTALFTGNKPAGAAVELTIDPDVQQKAYDALGDVQGSVVAMDPRTGQVIAMVSKPSYDPNELVVPSTQEVLDKYTELLEDDSQPLFNRAIGGNLQHPGSSFKVVVATAALENGLIKADTPLPNPPKYTLPGTSSVVYNPVHGQKCGDGETTNLKIALQYSCNIPFADLAIQLGADKIRAQAEKFGFNKPLEIPLDVTPSVYPTEAMDQAQVGLTGFGQFDVRVSPLQMAMVSAAIENGGVLMKPQLVNQVVSADLNQLQGPQVSEYGRVMSEETAKTMNELLLYSVSNGVAGSARIDGIDVGGKTGTAENGPDEPHTLWFTGYAASGNTHVAVAVMVEKGGGVDSASQDVLAATIGQQVLKAVLEQ